jgi:hypothetical protein
VSQRKSILLSIDLFLKAVIKITFKNCELNNNIQHMSWLHTRSLEGRLDNNKQPAMQKVYIQRLISRKIHITRTGAWPEMLG